MTTEMKRDEILQLVDSEKGLVDRRIYADDEIYRAELEQIFARAWNFMAHDSQIPNPGDFFQTYIGEDRVIVVRDKSGQAQVLLNTCRHRGNAVCRAEEGHGTSFMCTYHGWTYDLQGKLVGVPGFKDYYHEDLNREEWGLISAARVDSFKGFIFATLDPEAPSLEEFLGDVGRMSVNQIALRGDMKVVGGVQKYIINCNWKLAADNVWDFYHPQISHASQVMANWNPTQQNPDAFRRHIVVLGEYGHVLSGPEHNEAAQAQRERMLGDQSWRDRPEVKAELGPVGMRAMSHPHIFPNMWFATGAGQVSLRLPRSASSTEVWWFTFVDANATPELTTKAVRIAVHAFGPAGMLEQEDGENWAQSTRGTRGIAGRRFPLNYSMNVGRGEVIEDEGGPPYIEAAINEHAQLWHYRAWADWMAAESWADLRSSHTRVPSGFV